MKKSNLRRKLMKFRILILEDEKPQADRMNALLKKRIKEDLDITLVYGADEKITMKRFDIAIVDLNMPYINYSSLKTELSTSLFELNSLIMDENAGTFIINHLVKSNPNIFIIIRTSVSRIETVAKASNAAQSGYFRYIQKSIQGEYDILIDEVKAQIQSIKEKHPNRIDYGRLTYIHRELGDYESKDAKAYKYDRVEIDGVPVNLPTGGQRAALYKYLVNKEQWLYDRVVLEYAGYKVDGRDPEVVAKMYKDNIRKHLRFLSEAGLKLEVDYGMGKHRITKMEREDE